MEKIEDAFEEWLHTPMDDEYIKATHDGTLEKLAFCAGALHRQRELIEELRKELNEQREWHKSIPSGDVGISLIDELLEKLTTIEKEVE